MSETAKKLRIHGRVQGVFYRAWSRDQARSLGLTGWVRNRRDGTVEMLLAGEEAKVAEMIERCRDGPSGARVERIEVDETDEAVPESFETRPTS